MTWAPPSIRSARVRLRALRVSAGARRTMLPAEFCDGGGRDVEDASDEVAELGHLLGRGAGDVDGLLDLALEALAVFGGVLCDEDAGGIERNGEEWAMLQEDGHGLRVRGVVEVEAKLAVGRRTRSKTVRMPKAE